MHKASRDHYEWVRTVLQNTRISRKVASDETVFAGFRHSASVVTKAPFTMRIYGQLLEAVVCHGGPISVTEAFQFETTAISFSYCFVAVRDRRWVELCNRLKIPTPSALIIEETEMDSTFERLNEVDMMKLADEFFSGTYRHKQ